MKEKKKIIRITTVPLSLGGLLRGQLKFMSLYFDVIGIASPGNGKLDEVGKQEEIRTISVEMSRQITPLKDLKSLWMLYRIFKKERPDIVHTHTPKAGTLGMIAAYLAKVPNRLHTIAGLPLMEAKGTKRKILDMVEKITYSCATKVYPNSKGLMEFVLKHKYTSPKKLKVLGKGSSNGVDTEHFDPQLYSEQKKIELRKSLGISADDTVYIFVGRLVRDKGIEELIAAFNKICAENGKVRLLLVGTYEKQLDPLSEKTNEIIETNENIISVGWQKDVRPYFVIANLLTFPSYREGFPNVVMQAGAMGLPAIVTNINGCNEIIQHGQNGQIIPVKDVHSLYNAMNDYIHKSNYVTLNNNEIREHIKTNYERNEIWRLILKEYKNLLT